MKRKCFRTFTALLSIVILVSTTGCFRYQRKYTKDLEIYTPPQLPSFPNQWAVGPEGSVAYQFAHETVQSDEMDITPLVTRGSLDSLEKIATGKTLLATVRADHAYLSYQGNNQQVRTDATRAIGALRPLLVYILIKRDLGQGSSAASLPPGTIIITDSLWEGGSFIARQLLRASDKDPEQFEFEEVPSSEWDTALHKESVSAAVFTASFGDERIKKIIERGVFQLTSFPIDKMGVLLENCPYALPFRISPDSFPNQKEHILTVMIKNLLLVRVDCPADKVQLFCETFFPLLQEYNVKKQEVVGLANTLQGVSIPIHQGALRYYRSRCEFFTGDLLGSYYDLGIDLSSFFNRLLGPIILPRKSSGSAENINAIETLSGQLALIQSDIAYKTLTKQTLIVPEAPHLCTVAALSPENLHIVVKKGSRIHMLKDLVGKKISLGELGSGTMINAVEILKSSGIYDRLRKEDILFLNRRQLLPALQQGAVECFFQMTADPSDFLAILFKSGDYHFLKLPQDLINRLASEYPYYVPGMIPAGLYPYQNSTITTISTIALMVTHRDADPEIIKKIVTILGEHIQELSASQPQMKDLTLSQLWTRSSIPFHPAVLSVVSQRGWPLKQTDVSLAESTETPPYASGSAFSREEMKALIYPEETIITEEAIDKDSTYLPQERERRFMSLQEVTLIALRENLSIAIEANTPLLRQLDIAIEKAQFYPHLLVDAERSVRRIKDTSRSDTTAVEAAIEERLPSGATIKIGSDWITWDDKKVSRSYDFSSFFEMTQPLLEGAGLEVNLADYYISREHSEISLESFRDRIISTLTETRTQYYTVLRASQIFKILNQTLELSKQQLRRTAALVKVGKITEDQLTIAESNVSRREDDSIVARKNFKDQEDILLELLHAEYGYSVEPVLQLPSGEKEFLPIEPYAQDLMRVALIKRPDVRTALATLEVAAIEERVAKNAVLPKVDLKARVFNDSQVWDHSYQTFKAFEDYNDITFTLGLSLDLPVPNTEDRSASVQAQIERRRRLQELQQIKEMVQKEVRESIRRVGSAQERVIITKKALADAEEQLAEEIVKFRNGKTDNFNVFTTIRDFTEARLSELNSLVDYYQAVITQDQVLGVTDDRLKIRVYDALVTHPRFSEAYGQSETKELKMKK